MQKEKSSSADSSAGNTGGTAEAVASTGEKKPTPPVKSAKAGKDRVHVAKGVSIEYDTAHSNPPDPYQPTKEVG